MSARRPLFAAALLGAAAALAGCARRPPEPVKAPPPVVYVAEPTYQKVNDYEDFAGRTEPFKVVELRSRVTGHLKKIHFKDGQDIDEGEPLFDLDSRIYRAQLEQAQATLVKAEAHLRTATDNYNRSRSCTSAAAPGRRTWTSRPARRPRPRPRWAPSGPPPSSPPPTCGTAPSAPRSPAG
jgi:multidrug efflux system membrane fusion protein